MFRPCNGRIYVTPDPPAEQSKGGIILADVAREQPSSGVVVAIDAGVMKTGDDYQPPICRIGERVLYGKYAGVTFQDEGKAILVLKPEDILAICE